MSTIAGANRLAAESLVDELGRAGVRDACVSPGSRSTPLVLALARQSDIHAWVITDERASAYFALGMARATGRPTVVVCTSGTAAANLLPACVEASLASVPLILLTADRPDELRECGAPQTIRQAGLLSSHARWSFDLAVPDPTAPLEAYYRTVACRAFSTSVSPLPGPVHLNVPFREPLMDAVEEAGADPACADARAGERPWTVVRSGSVRIEAEATAPLARRFAATRRGLFVCGPDDPSNEDREATVALATRLGWPILADPLCGLRYGAHDKRVVIDGADVLVRSEAFVASHRPELILRLGGPPVSKPVVQFMSQAGCDQILVAPAGVWPDPTFRVSEVVRGGGGAFCGAVLAALSADGLVGDGERAAAPSAGATGWLAEWRGGARVVGDVLAHELAADDSDSSSAQSLYEGRVAAELLDRLPDGATLVVGNSMPVRDLDLFGRCRDRALRVIGNRGANGIDGVVATALGVAARGDGPVALLIGDLSFLHDVGSLQIAARHGLDLLIVLINNDGGGIFHYLPPARLGPIFEELFATPHGLPIEPFVRACGGAHALIRSWRVFASQVDAAFERGGLSVLEVPTDRARAAVRRTDLVARAIEALAAAPGLGEAAA